LADQLEETQKATSGKAEVPVERQRV
jgi:hypothetical protein